MCKPVIIFLNLAVKDVNYNTYNTIFSKKGNVHKTKNVGFRST